MNRRQFIAASVSGGILIGIGSGYAWVNDGLDVNKLTIDNALITLDNLADKTVTSTGQWNLYQIFSHAAQSVEYSMTGYPLHKSDTFKNTVGKLAFSAFSTKGKMIHGLSEEIPGAPLFEKRDDAKGALLRLIQSLKDFQQFAGELAPHFAYGVLSKDEYGLAHVMHLHNHFDEISIV
ncbi:twin-arginine translocation pathway signal [Gammaproteobacteria bacterium 45_16_T64]|nr:twin-arginine translocation pathway signal [Gammaproteobacteria bacterium 45_16_T64]